MRILHVVESLFKYGGANVACVDFANKQAELGHEVALFTTSVPTKDEIIVSQKVKLVVKCKRVKLRLARLSYIADLNEKIKQTIIDFKPDIVHVHALWDPLVCNHNITNPYKTKRIKDPFEILRRWFLRKCECQHALPLLVFL